MSVLHPILERESFKSLIHFAEKFSKICNNKFFEREWNSQLDLLLKNNRNPLVKEVERRVWQPALKGCCTLLHEFSTLKVKLSTVYTAFKDSPQDYIQRELTDFYDVVNECADHQSQFERGKMFTAAKKIKEFFEIDQHQEVATLFLKIKAILKLRGNFGDVAIFAKKVCDVRTCVKHLSYLHVSERLLLHMGAKFSRVYFTQCNLFSCPSAS